MPIQSDNRLFPNLIPGPPEDEAELLEWARDTAGALQDLSRQLVDKFNLHTVQTHGHPESWKTWRLKRPSFRASLTDTSQLILEASSTYPKHFVIGGALFETTSNLTLDLDTSGVGGLRTGLTKANSTVYYLYAVNNSGSVALIADTVAPSTGLTGYTNWTYLGSFVTTTAAAFFPFWYMDGVYHHGNGDSGLDVDSSDTSATAKTFIISAVAKRLMVRMSFAAINAAGDVIGVGPTSSTITVLKTNTTTVAQSPTGFAIVPVLTALTMYVNVTNAADTARFRPLMWAEDPTEFS